MEEEQKMVRFDIHPEQGNTKIERICTAMLIDERNVTDSGGHSETRIVIATSIILYQDSWPVEITLTSRDSVKFRTKYQIRLMPCITPLKNRSNINKRPYPNGTYLRHRHLLKRS